MLLRCAKLYPHAFHQARKRLIVLVFALLASSCMILLLLGYYHQRYTLPRLYAYQSQVMQKREVKTKIKKLQTLSPSSQKVPSSFWYHALSITILRFALKNHLIMTALEANQGCITVHFATLSHKARLALENQLIQSDQHPITIPHGGNWQSLELCHA